MHTGERQAGIDAAAVDHDGAGAALAVVAALFGAGEVQVIAQRIQQRRAGVGVKTMVFAVNGQCRLHEKGALCLVTSMKKNPRQRVRVPLWEGCFRRLELGRPLPRRRGRGPVANRGHGRHRLGSLAVGTKGKTRYHRSMRLR